MPLEALVASNMPSSNLPPHSSKGGKRSRTETAVQSTSPEAETSAIPFIPFTQSQLSLALSIQRSKPATISTREFCLQLQAHIRQGKPTPEGKQRYIDTAEFWREQYCKLHSEKQAMKVRLDRLEVLTSQHNTAIAIEPYSSTISVGNQSEVIPNELGSSANLPLLKQALVLHRLLRDNKVPTDVLLSTIQSSIWYMDHAIGDACSRTSRGSSSTIDNANNMSIRTFNTVAAVFNMCLNGLAHLCRDIPGRRCKGQIIYSLVRFFCKSLSHLHTLCHERAAYEAIETIRHHNTASYESDYKDPNITLIVISRLAKFLTSLFTCPEFEKAHLSHMDVLEGMFSALLEEVGGLMSQAIFNDQLSTSNKPGRITCIDKNASESMNEIAKDLKGRHLVYILKRVLEGRSEKDRQSLAAMLANIKRSGTNVSKEVLLSRAKQRLQETLLKGIFGDDGEEFMSALRMPESGEGWDAEAPPIVPDEGQNFVETVWSTVGWDLLSNG